MISADVIVSVDFIFIGSGTLLLIDKLPGLDLNKVPELSPVNPFIFIYLYLCHHEPYFALISMEINLGHLMSARIVYQLSELIYERLFVAW